MKLVGMMWREWLVCGEHSGDDLRRKSFDCQLFLSPVQAHRQVGTGNREDSGHVDRRTSGQVDMQTGERGVDSQTYF